MALALTVGGSPLAGAQESNKPPALAAAQLILMQLGNDMLYGTDDFFGENRDIIYVDLVSPTPPSAAVPATAVAASTASPAAPAGGVPAASTPAAPADGGTTTPGAGNGDTPPTPDIPAPDVPVDPGAGGCPT